MPDRRESAAVLLPLSPNGYEAVPQAYDDMTGLFTAAADILLDRAGQATEAWGRVMGALLGARTEAPSLPEIPPGEGRRVIFVPGRGGSASDWASVTRTLARSEYVPIPFRGSVTESAGVLTALVDQTLEAADQSPTGQVSLVGHSVGGGLVEEAASHSATKGVVDSIVEIDAFHGTVNGNPVGRERSRADVHDGTAITKIGASQGLLLRRGSALTGPGTKVSLSRGHWGILEHPLLPLYIAHGVLNTPPPAVRG